MVAAAAVCYGVEFADKVMLVFVPLRAVLVVYTEIFARSVYVTP
jgi:hypothetical protein